MKSIHLLCFPFLAKQKHYYVTFVTQQLRFFNWKATCHVPYDNPYSPRCQQRLAEKGLAPVAKVVWRISGNEFKKWKFIQTAIWKKKTDPKEIKDVQKENFMLDSKRIPTLFSEMWTWQKHLRRAGKPDTGQPLHEDRCKSLNENVKIQTHWGGYFSVPVINRWWIWYSKL